MSFLRSALNIWDMVGSLAAFLERPLTEAEARAVIRERVGRRDELFLMMAREAFYAGDSPYRTLLAHAGCDYRDLEIMLRQRGLSQTLESLRRAGVYLSFEEFKTGVPVRRDGQVFQFAPHQFDNTKARRGVSMRSGGSRSTGMWADLSFDYLNDANSTQLAIALNMLAAPNTPVITWQLGFPSGAGFGTWLTLAKLHRPPEHWFSLNPMPGGFRSRHRLQFELARFLAARAGARMPGPEFASVGEVNRVLTAILTARDAAGACVVMTTPSCAVRLCARARQQQTRLDQVVMYVGAEPLTEGKAEEIRLAGARVASRYVAAEIGGAGAAPCGAPGAVDDMHFRSDLLAMIASPREFGHLTVESLMLTSLLPTAPKILLNVELDDFAQIEHRACGCIWDELGCGPHLSGLRSFTKLTGEGTTVLGSNCVYVLERVLPEAFGGTSVDYQLVEAQDEQALTRLYLLINPRIGPLDERAVLRRFKDALQATRGQPLGGMRTIWDQADSIRVLRRTPLPTRGGKLLPFHTIGASNVYVSLAPSARREADDAAAGGT